jgi:AAA domain
MQTMESAYTDAIFAMFKGEPGTRKSTSALSFPGPQYWFSTDRKMNALQIPMRNWNIDPKLIHYDDYFDYTSMRVKLEQLKINCPYKTIVDDSITSNADVINRQTLRAKSGKSNKQGEEKGLTIGGIPVSGLDDYKAEAAAFSEMIALLKDIHKEFNVNIILIAHVIGERDKEHAAGSTHFSRIIATGGKAISAKIPAYCDETYHFNIKGNLDADKEGDYTIITRHTGTDYARTALPLPREVKFNNEPLYKFIKEAQDKLKDGK